MRLKGNIYANNFIVKLNFLSVEKIKIFDNIYNYSFSKIKIPTNCNSTFNRSNKALY